MSQIPVDAMGASVFNAVQSYLSTHALAVAAEKGHRPRRLDVVLATPAARAAFEALFPELAAAGSPPTRREPMAPIPTQPPPPPGPRAA